jgi:hypothetical protein
MESQVIAIRPPDEEGRRLWELVLSLAAEIGPDRQWSLIGGLMVQLHGFEHGDLPRPTVDIDVLAGARQPPRMTEEIAELLVGRGAELAMPPRSDPKLGYRFSVHGETVELLGPDGLRSDPKTTAGLRTFQTPGGTQALRRSEVVPVSLDGGDAVGVRRPNLLGAILIKARVATEKRAGKYLSDRQDLIRLLGYVEDPRRLSVELGGKEPGWLRDAEIAIEFDDDSLGELFSQAALARARRALRLLVQESYSESSTK